MHSKRFFQVVKDHITRYQLIPPQTRLLVACSGGQDSMAMVHALHTMVQVGWLIDVDLHIAHIDHGLRGEDSAADARRVQALADALSLPASIVTITPTERAMWTGSIEAAAREARYNALRGIARAVHAHRIAIGHTIDDQAETVLMHLLRGSGVDGLSGMRPWSQDLIRPFLSIRRADTLTYCQQYRLNVVEDASNNDRRFTRNQLRHDIIPVLETLQPDMQPILARNATMLAYDADYLNQLAERFWKEVLIEAQDQRLILHRGKLSASPASLRWRIIRYAVGLLGDTHRDQQVSYDTLLRCDAVLLDSRGNRRVVQLAAQVDAVFTRGCVEMVKRITTNDAESAIS